MKKRSMQYLALASTLTLAASLSTRAAVTADLTLGNVSSFAEYGFTASIPGGTLTSGEIIGIYSFTVANVAGGTLPGFTANPFWSTCLSPGGALDFATHSYTLEDYATASPGLNPSAWASGGGQLWGIQNAQYLWRKFGAGILGGGSNPDAGAGLALAMYAALYNSTGYGALGGSAFNVSNWGGHTGAQTDYGNYLLALNATAVGNNLATGSLLVPTPTGGSGNNQEFIINFTPVPEPTTMIAGALLLLPFAASTLRMVRKNRTA